MAKKYPKMGTLTRRADELTSLIVRTVTPYCERCGGTRWLQCAHNVTRDNRRLRFDRANLMTLCASCHTWWGDYPMTAGKWFESIRPLDAAYIEEHQNERVHRTPPDMLDLIEELKVELARVQELKDAA